MSIGTPNCRGRIPAAARSAEPRPSQATVRSALSAPVSPEAVRYSIPVMRSPERSRPVASVLRRRWKVGSVSAAVASISRKSHCGAIAMCLCGPGSRFRSPNRNVCSPRSTVTCSTRLCGMAANLGPSPNSSIRFSVLACTVSPRKSRRKSGCFSSTVTSIPARANSNASIIPAGPPPAMAHVVPCGSSGLIMGPPPCHDKDTDQRE